MNRAMATSLNRPSEAGFNSPSRTHRSNLSGLTPKHAARLFASKPKRTRQLISSYRVRDSSAVRVCPNAIRDLVHRPDRVNLGPQPVYILPQHLSSGRPFFRQLLVKWIQYQLAADGINERELTVKTLPARGCPAPEEIGSQRHVRYLCIPYHQSGLPKFSEQLIAGRRAKRDPRFLHFGNKCIHSRLALRNLPLPIANPILSDSNVPIQAGYLGVFRERFVRKLSTRHGNFPLAGSEPLVHGRPIFHQFVQFFNRCILLAHHQRVSFARFGYLGDAIVHRLNFNRRFFFHSSPLPAARSAKEGGSPARRHTLCN